MTRVSVLALVRNREAHLRQLIEGLRRSGRRPDELVVVDMSDRPVAPDRADFPIRLDRLETDGLPLAAARNRAAALASGDRLIFLDVDCIPMTDCIGRLVDVLEEGDALLCADVRYLGPRDARAGWTETELLRVGRSHAVRQFPTSGTRDEPNAGLFWSLAFAIRAERFRALGGFDERYDGYGAEDTDFGFRAVAAGLPLRFVGGALACHQHHASHEPPVQHVRSIVRNAALFRERWGRWPMEGWLRAFADMGLIEWHDDRISFLREPTAAQWESTSVQEDSSIDEPRAQML